jgi:hypothetical protein
MQISRIHGYSDKKGRKKQQKSPRKNKPLSAAFRVSRVIFMTAELPTVPYQRPPWPAAVAALVAYAALALSSGAMLPLTGLGIGLAASYVFAARYENETLTKWTLRILVIGGSVFGYLITAVKDEYAFFDVRYVYSFALAAAAETMLQFWRREPTSGARAPFTVFLSAMVFLIGCSTSEDSSRSLWLLAPLFFLFFTLALPGFRQRSVPLRALFLPVLAALLLGGLTQATFARYKNALNLLGSAAGHPTSAGMGMSGQPLLGASFTLRDSLTRVLRVHALGPDSYLRGMTFDTYTGHGWGPSLDDRVFLQMPHQNGNAPGHKAHFIRMDDALGLLFAPLHSAAIVPEGRHSAEWATRTDGPLRTPPADTDPLTYDVTEGNSGLLDAPPTPAEQARDLTLSPSIDRRVLILARKIGSGPKTPTQKIAAVIGFLHTNNKYSLTVNPGPGEPISNFILQHKSAHCEYFASSAVILLRAIGLPTRYVSGYYAFEEDGRNWTLVRQRDAHAWAESWVAGTGWVTVDATPGDGRPDALAGPIPFYWRVWEKIQDILGALRNWIITASWTAKGSVFIVLILGLLVPQVYRYVQKRHVQSLGFRYSGSDAALALLSERFEALLARRGIPCPETRTWPEHLALTHTASDSALSDFVRNYGRARFGPTPTRKEITQISQMLDILEKQVLEKSA